MALKPGPLLVALIAPPICASVVLGAVLASIDPPNSMLHSSGWASLFWLYAWYTLIFALPATIILGLLAHAILQRLRLYSLPAYAVPGIVAGLVIPAFVLPNDAMVLLCGAFVGAATTTLAWLIRRPDADHDTETSPF